MHGDSGPSLFEAIVYALVTILALVAIVICVGPIWDWFAIWLLTIDSPLVSTVMPLFKYLWLLIALIAIGVVGYIWVVVIRKIRYNRMMEEMYR